MLVKNTNIYVGVEIAVELALDRLRLQAPESETIYYIFILDDQRRLLGVLSLRAQFTKAQNRIYVNL